MGCSKTAKREPLAYTYVKIGAIHYIGRFLVIPFIDRERKGKVGRCSLRSLDYPENLPASFGTSVVPSLPHAVKGAFITPVGRFKSSLHF